MTVSETAAEATLRADRDKEIALADADLQKQLTGNESAHTTAVNNANSAHSTATANAEAARKSAEQAALTQLNSTLAQATKDKEASIAGAERTYDQAVASLDAQYGSASSNGVTGVEGATRRSAIKTRDAQYYAARDTSWANTLSGSTTLGTSPWTVKAITAANAGAAFSTSRANAQAAHDAAMLDAVDDWQLSSRESLTDLLFTEGQSRETYNVATSNVYANWENGIGNLLGDKPEGTGWGFDETGGGTETGNPIAARWLGRAFWGGDETDGAAGNQGNSNLKTDRPPNPKDAKKIAPPNETSDEDKVKELEPYFKAFYGNEGRVLLDAFRASRAKIRFVGHWSWSIWWTGGSDLEGDYWSPDIVIDETLSPPKRAEHLMKQLIAASAHSGVQFHLGGGDTSDETLQIIRESAQRGVNKAAAQVEQMARAYYEGIGIVSIGADVVVTANELYEHKNPWALLGLLPLVPSKVWSSSGNVIVRAGNNVSVRISESISGVLSRLNKAQLDELTAKLAKANTDEEAQQILEQFAKLADNAPKGTFNTFVMANRRTGNKVLDTLAKDSTQLPGFLEKLRKAGYSIETGKIDGGAVGQFSNGVFKYDPDNFRVFHLMHENRHFSQIQAAKRVGIDPFDIERPLRAAFEYDAYNFELWLGKRFGLNNDYIFQTWHMRDKNYFPVHDQLLRDEVFLKKLHSIFGYNPFK